MAELFCRICGEPWHCQGGLHWTHTDMPWSSFQNFIHGAGCSCCEGVEPNFTTEADREARQERWARSLYGATDEIEPYPGFPVIWVPQQRMPWAGVKTLERLKQEHPALRWLLFPPGSEPLPLSRLPDKSWSPRHSARVIVALDSDHEDEWAPDRLMGLRGLGSANSLVWHIPTDIRAEKANDLDDVDSAIATSHANHLWLVDQVAQLNQGVDPDQYFQVYHHAWSPLSIESPGAGYRNWVTIWLGHFDPRTGALKFMHPGMTDRLMRLVKTLMQVERDELVGPETVVEEARSNQDAMRLEQRIDQEIDPLLEDLMGKRNFELARHLVHEYDLLGDDLDGDLDRGELFRALCREHFAPPGWNVHRSAHDPQFFIAVNCHDVAPADPDKLLGLDLQGEPFWGLFNRSEFGTPVGWHLVPPPALEAFLNRESAKPLLAQVPHD